MTVVPTFLLYQVLHLLSLSSQKLIHPFQNGKILDRIVGANGPELASKVEKYSKSQASSNTTNDSTTDKERINDRLTKLINFAPVMLFMKVCTCILLCALFWCFFSLSRQCFICAVRCILYVYRTQNYPPLYPLYYVFTT